MSTPSPAPSGLTALTLAGARATIAAIAAVQHGGTLGVSSLQEYHRNIAYWETASKRRVAGFGMPQT